MRQPEKRNLEGKSSFNPRTEEVNGFIVGRRQSTTALGELGGRWDSEEARGNYDLSTGGCPVLNDTGQGIRCLFDPDLHFSRDTSSNSK